MSVIGALILLASAALLSWHNRPATGGEWPGSAAARFAAGLMMLGYGVTAILALWPDSDVGDSERLLRQLSLYAALPMVVSSHLAERLGHHWTRQVWGRIFLVWCVVFELCRRNEALDWALWLTLAAGVLALVLPLLLPGRLQHTPLTHQEKLLNLLAPLGLWLALSVMLLINENNLINSLAVTLWLGIGLTAFCLAQRVSYRMAT